MYAQSIFPEFEKHPTFQSIDRPHRYFCRRCDIQCSADPYLDVVVVISVSDVAIYIGLSNQIYYMIVDPGANRSRNCDVAVTSRTGLETTGKL